MNLAVQPRACLPENHGPDHHVFSFATGFPLLVRFLMESRRWVPRMTGVFPPGGRASLSGSLVRENLISPRSSLRRTGAILTWWRALFCSFQCLNVLLRARHPAEAFSNRTQPCLMIASRQTIPDWLGTAICEQNW